MTSSNGNSFHVTSLLCREFTGHRNQQLSKQRSRWWFETPSRPLWRNCNGMWQLSKLSRDYSRNLNIKKRMASAVLNRITLFMQAIGWKCSFLLCWIQCLFMATRRLFYSNLFYASFRKTWMVIYVIVIITEALPYAQPCAQLLIFLWLKGMNIYFSPGYAICI